MSFGAYFVPHISWPHGSNLCGSHLHHDTELSFVPCPGSSDPPVREPQGVCGHFGRSCRRPYWPNGTRWPSEERTYIRNFLYQPNNSVSLTDVSRSFESFLPWATCRSFLLTDKVLTSSLRLESFDRRGKSPLSTRNPQGPFLLVCVWN